MSSASSSRRRTLLRVLLVVSLALNLAGLGLVAGAALRWQAGGAMQTETGAPDRQAERRAAWIERRAAERDGAGREGVRGMPVAALGPHGRALDREGREAWRARAALRQEDFAAGRAELRASLAALAALLEADSFDAEAAASLLERQRHAARAQEARAHELLLEVLSEMSAEERAAMAARLLRRP